ncbi:MAG: vitamin B12 dependent-methionine synthase activation domain-containing protein, partial [Bacteroidota bacterium]
ASELINPKSRGAFKTRIKQEYVDLRKDHEGKQQLKNYISIAEARKNKVNIDWTASKITKPTFVGRRTLLNYPLEEIAQYIDWTPFFQTWMLYGRYPDIFKDEKVGVEAKKLFDDAQVMLQRFIAGRKLTANAVLAFYPANSTETDDVVLYQKDETAELKTLHFLRQQNKKAKDLPNFCLSDFVAPQSTGKRDYVGMFAVTAGMGLEKLVNEYKAKQDDYSEIMAKALADRLAEAFAELLHAKVRRELWGYAKDEKLENTDLIEEKYEGIRPAPGYPACPDHTEKKTIFELLDAENEAGIQLTESFAMYPAAAVSGYYFAHADAKYFGLGKIEKDQVKDYAQRKGMKLEEMERWLAPNLAY